MQDTQTFMKQMRKQMLDFQYNGSLYSLDQHVLIYKVMYTHVEYKNSCFRCHGFSYGFNV